MMNVEYTVTVRWNGKEGDRALYWAELCLKDPSLVIRIERRFKHTAVVDGSLEKDAHETMAMFVEDGLIDRFMAVHSDAVKGGTLNISSINVMLPSMPLDFKTNHEWRRR